MKTLAYLSALSLIAFAAADGPSGVGKGAKAPSKDEPVPATPPPGAITSQLALADTAKAIVGLGGEGATVKLPNGATITVKRQVTRAVFPQKDGETIFVLCQGKIYEGEKVKSDKQKDMPPARLMPVANLVTGQLGLIIMNTVLEEELHRAYKDDSYIDKQLGITMNPKREGQRYKTFVIFEVDLTPPKPLDNPGPAPAEKTA